MKILRHLARLCGQPELAFHPVLGRCEYCMAHSPPNCELVDGPCLCWRANPRGLFWSDRLDEALAERIQCLLRFGPSSLNGSRSIRSISSAGHWAANRAFGTHPRLD
jgi:hypothetical protein